MIKPMIIHMIPPIGGLASDKVFGKNHQDFDFEKFDTYQTAVLVKDVDEVAHFLQFLWFFQYTYADGVLMLNPMSVAEKLTEQYGEPMYIACNDEKQIIPLTAKFMEESTLEIIDWTPYMIEKSTRLY